MQPSILFVAGKSGGHIVPALTLIQRWCAEQPAGKVTLVTTNAPLDRKIVQQFLASNPYGERFQHKDLPLGFVARTWWKVPFLVWNLGVAFWRSLRLLRNLCPDTVVSMGGLVSVPVCIAARLLGIPYELYELNVVPGAAVTFLQRAAHKIHLCFPETRAYLRSSVQPRAVMTGYPLRFTDLDRKERAAALQSAGLDPKHKVLLVLGGSQGSRSLNALVQATLLARPAALQDLQVVHQTGEHDVEALRAFYDEQGISARVFAYSDSMALWYSSADVVITRAGSGALHELQFFGACGIIIPLEVATTDHQVENAQAVVAANPERWSLVRQAALAQRPSLLVDLLVRYLRES